MENTTAPARTATPVVLWVVLAVSAAVNAGGSVTGLDFTLRMIAGGIALAATAGLITYYVRRRQQR
ncbi:hypothetical protein SAMN05421837_110138 [Amycolatopsis pretoriensis]|uniref:Uncharacterized protein n=1 Tax=Amycolatopsis pretoriensis TaxID=218821 RepID=A0A1H5RDF4_9PSEU|nr:hypothetical protein [Amycolatopsis pretoriensis]SEF36383.1 hypothetical protein SAMN05421837_110138 [Amycolatopsis pretoriensis]